MFSNLIESGSHASDLKRRGRFFLGTTLFYALLLCAAGVGSIYAYNVRLDYNPDYEVLALMRFPPSEATRETARRTEARPATGPARPDQVARRTEVSMHTPYATRVARADTPEIRTNQAVVLADFNSDPLEAGGPAGPHTPGVIGPPSNSRAEGPAVVDAGEAPQPTPRPAPAPAPRQNDKPLTLTSTVISSKVVEKPAPPYPPIAKAAGVQGPVAVQIVVDERGRVVSAKATSGNPLLQRAAVEAAYRASFTPTLLGGQPVKVTGSITYNFVLR